MKKLVISGGGNMGLAIATGITKNKIYKRENILIIEKDKNRSKLLTKLGFKVTTQLTKKQDINVLILAVKPNDIKEAANSLEKLISKNTIVISIAAGIKIDFLSALFKKGQPIVRVMPNTPCQIAQGMSAITFNKYINKNQKTQVFKIFNSLGKTIEFKENLFDAVTAVSGSGPAYICLFIENLIKSAESLGFNKKDSSSLVIQTALGTLLLLTKKNLTPEVLRKTVTSPKGTTEAALRILQKKDFYNIILTALTSAKKRSIELGENK